MRGRKNENISAVRLLSAISQKVQFWSSAHCDVIKGWGQLTLPYGQASQELPSNGVLESQASFLFVLLRLMLCDQMSLLAELTFMRRIKFRLIYW